jgi:hypothetical protein
MLQNSLNLYQESLQKAAAAPVPFIADLGNRPVFFLGPLSLLGQMRGPAIASRLKQPVAVIDDIAVGENIYGIRRCSTSKFVARAGARSRRNAAQHNAESTVLTGLLTKIKER